MVTPPGCASVGLVPQTPLTTKHSQKAPATGSFRRRKYGGSPLPHVVPLDLSKIWYGGVVFSSASAQASRVMGPVISSPVWAASVIQRYWVLARTKFAAPPIFPLVELAMGPPDSTRSLLLAVESWRVVPLVSPRCQTPA